MSFTTNFSRETLKGTPFETMSEAELREHLARARYGDFFLTDAVRPSPIFEPTEGYRLDTYRDAQGGLSTPVIMAAASREKLFDLFMQLCSCVGKMADVILESTHDRTRRNRIGDSKVHSVTPDAEIMIIESHLYDFEELLLDDGCTGIAMSNGANSRELQFDDHKIFIIYASTLAALRPFERILQSADLQRRDGMLFVHEQVHVHSSTEAFRARFDELRNILCAEEE